jgi:uncharacterized protein YoxC
MQPWAQAVLVLSAVAVAAAMVAALLAVRQTLRRTDAVLDIVEQEMRPLIGQLHGLADEVRGLTRETTAEIRRVAEVTGRVNDAAEGVGRVVTALAGFTRVGQMVGVAAGLKKGFDVFVQRLGRNEGDHDE